MEFFGGAMTAEIPEGFGDVRYGFADTFVFFVFGIWI